MSKDHKPAFSISLSNFPQKILLGNHTYHFKFICQNLLNKTEKFYFKIQADNLNIINISEFSKGLTFNPNEEKEKILDVIPNGDGSSKINLDVFCQKKGGNSTNSLKIKNSIKIDEIQPILNGKELNYLDLEQIQSNMQKSINLDGLNSISKEDAMKKIRDLSQSLGDERIKSIILIAKQVISQDIIYCYEILNLIPDLEKKFDAFSQVIPIGIYYNINATLNQVMKITNSTLKNELLQKIAYSIFNSEPNNSIMVLSYIDDLEYRDDSLINLIFNNSKLDPKTILDFLNNITSIEKKLKISLDFCKIWKENYAENAANTLKTIIHNSITHNFTDLMSKSVYLLAFILNPQLAHDFIKSFNKNPNLIAMQPNLDNILKDKSEDQIDINNINIVAQIFYVFPCLSNKIPPSIEFLERIKGNMSINLLEQGTLSNICILSPFKNDFSIFMNLQTAYFQIEKELKKKFSYIIFPVENGIKENDFKHLNGIINQYITKSKGKRKNPYYIILLDFIPYLEKPTIIFSNNENFENIKNKFHKKKSLFDIYVDDSFFKEGEISKQLKANISDSKIKIISVVLNYNFLKEFNLLKNFLTSIIEY